MSAGDVVSRDESLRAGIEARGASRPPGVSFRRASAIRVLSKMPAYKLCRAFGVPRTFPVNLTVGLTYRCNSRCKTCRVYTRTAEELSLGEYERIFQSIGSSPYWITFSGGEPFMRDDLADICIRACELCGPAIINIPTNGFLTDRICRAMSRILHACPNTELGIGQAHDEIRSCRGSFDRAMATYQGLKAMQTGNLTLGFHTVISRFNAKEIPRIYNELKALGPDSYVTEIAEQRVELLTIEADIAPSIPDYCAAVDSIVADMRQWKTGGVSRVTRALRRRYYGLVKRLLKGGRSPLPCYAGIASCQVAPDGEVWACCTRAESMGNLRESQYDFGRVWLSAEADQVRSAIKERRCSCPLANTCYTNMLFSLRTLFGIAAEVSLGR